MSLIDLSETKQYSTAAVIVTSDTCFKDPKLDESGPFVVNELTATSLFKHVYKFICTDDAPKIIACLEKALIHYDPSLIVTVGGTGLCPRDVTPETTSSLYDKHCAGIATALHVNNLRYSPHAALSRLGAGIIGGTLVVNFPGKLSACRDCLSCLRPLLEHALEQVRFDRASYVATHKRQLQEKLDRGKSGGEIMPTMATGNNSAKQITHSSGARNVALSSCKSLDNLASGGGKSGNKNIRPHNSNHNNGGHSFRPRSRNNSAQRGSSRSSSVASRMNKLSIEAIVESRSELSHHERDSRQPPQAGRPSFKPALGAQPKKAAPKVAPKNQVELSYTPLKPIVVKQPVAQASPLPEVKILRNKSAFEMISFSEALKILSDLAANVYKETEVVELTNFSRAYNCCGATLAEDLKPKRLVPPFACSTVDGYVLHVPKALMGAKSIKTNQTELPVVENLAEFERRAKSEPGKFFCFQVNTGGRLPFSEFAVIPVELTKPGIAPNTVTIEEAKPHKHVRRPGSDISDEDTIKSGTQIGPVELSCIIAMGHRKISVLHKPKIGILSTGDELEDFFSNEFMNQNSVADSNGPMLAGLFRKLGYHVTLGGIARDTPNELLAKISDTLNKCHVLLITGGASMGSRDHVKDVIQHMGGAIHFGRVGIKPGKPAALASLMHDSKRKFIFSLPGNPVSAFVTAQLLVIPFLKHAANRYSTTNQLDISDHLGEKIWAKVDKIDEPNERYLFDGRLEFVRARLLCKQPEFHGEVAKSVYTVDVSTKQHSSRLLSLVDCDCLLLIDPGLKGRTLSRDLIYPAIKLDNKL